MAAPSNAYRTEKLHDGTTTANSVKADIAIPNATESVLKSRFYLDFLLNTERNGVAGFIGGCTIGSDNYAMHNTARHWTGRGRGPAGQTIQWFNDAGLNTLGTVAAVPNISQHSLSAFIIASFTVQSAYYDNGIYGVQINPGSGWATIQFGNIPQNTSLSSDVTDISDYVEFGQTIQVRSYHQNAEGVFVSPTVRTVTVQAGTINMYYHASTASLAESSSALTARYYTVKLLIGGKLYSDSGASTPVPDGFYVDTAGGRWYRVTGGAGDVIQSGSAVPGGWPSGDPANYMLFEWVAFAVNNAANACAISAPTNTYRSYLDNKHYSGPSLTTLATDGFYSRGTGPARLWVQITAGVEVANGLCSDPL